MDYYGPMMRPYGLVFLFLLALAPAAPAQPATETTPQNSALDDVLLYQLLVAEFSQNEGDSATAFSAFLDAARKTGDARLYRRAVDVALQSHAGDAAMQAARAWVAAQPASLEANHYLLQILVGMNRPRETLEPLKREIASVAPEQRTQALLSIPRQFARITDKKAATVVVEQALNVCQTTVVQEAWQRGQELVVHGWVYGLQNGLLQDLHMTVNRLDDAGLAYEAAIAAVRSRHPASA